MKAGKIYFDHYDDLKWLSNIKGCGRKFMLSISSILYDLDDGYSSLDVEWLIRAGKIYPKMTSEFSVARYEQLKVAVGLSLEKVSNAKIKSAIFLLESNGYTVTESTLKQRVSA